MPHTKSAKKSLRKTEKNRLRNRTTKRIIKTHLKRFDSALSGPVDAVQTEFNLASKKLDKAAARGILHRNTVARKKSQMARQLQKKKATAASGS
ncbi:MAG: 30S ribosomal protein S20 [Gemmataceae bacterium]